MALQMQLSFLLLCLVSSFVVKSEEDNGGLFPSIFNLATNAIIIANATCGEIGPEVYCKLVEHGILKEPQCGVCDAKLPTKSHPITNAIDGSNNWWQSPTLQNGKQYEWITITLDLRQVYQIAYIILKAGISPRPGNWILERSIDGLHYKPWQYYVIHDGDCWDIYGIRPNVGKLKFRTDNDVVCTSHYSKINPLENGEIHTSLINGRPSADDPSPSLKEFTTARFVRLRLQKIRTLNADLMLLQNNASYQDKSVTRRIHTSLINGRPSADDPSPSLKKHQCQCEHNTCGENCEMCCPLDNQQPWKEGTKKNGAECESCQCFGHAERCYYDPIVARKKLSLNSFGKYEGGGVCIKCQHHTIGINCEKCEDGYFRPLGIAHNSSFPCHECFCTGPGVTGVCVKDDSYIMNGLKPGDCLCKKGYAGNKCDHCDVGYTNFPECKPCPCHTAGTIDGNTCEGKCICKKNVEGERCDSCKPGFYNLDVNNPDGCSKCFCSGVTHICESNDWGIEIVRQMEDWIITDLLQKIIYPAIPENGVLKIQTLHLPENIELFWQAPIYYLGKKLYSYGGELRIALKYHIPKNKIYGSFIEGPGVILESRRQRIAYSLKPQPEGETFTLIIPLTDKGWRYFKKSGKLGRKVGRKVFLMILNDLTRLLIRMRFHTDQTEGILVSVEMEVATEYSSNFKKLKSVEKCQCPPNFAGLSCEYCDPGFRRVNNTIFMGKCQQCNCNNHAETCDYFTGKCKNCLHNTTGPICNICEVGFYGNPLFGTPEDCQKCKCPLENRENNFSPTCLTITKLYGKVDYICTACPMGYEGDKCERCGYGFFGNPMIPGSYCQKCDCSGNADISDPNYCNQLTGQCLKCVNNTSGWNCHECAENYFGNALLHNCQLVPAECWEELVLFKDCKRDGTSEKDVSFMDVKASSVVSSTEKEVSFADVVPIYKIHLNLLIDIKLKSIFCGIHISYVQNCLHNTTGPICNICEVGFYGNPLFGTPEDCQKCKCPLENRENNFSPTCLTITKLYGKVDYICTACPMGYEGDKCERCGYGFFGNPMIPGSYCQKCDCSGNADISDPNYCNQLTGQCLKCVNNTSGWNCHECAENYFGNALLHNCQPCECNEYGSLSKECDTSLGICQCKGNYVGRNCARCADGYGNIEAGCLPCSCNKHGSISKYCDPVSGQCPCKPGIFGMKCDICLDGYYGFSNKGCEWCGCNIYGSESHLCDETSGQCICRSHVYGRTCDSCEDEYWNLISEKGCEYCSCNKTGSTSPSCDPIYGNCECKPGVGGQFCDHCLPDYYGFSENGCSECQECEITGYVCDSITGECLCPPHTTGKNCETCLPLFWGYDAKFGCKPCNCNPSSSHKEECDPLTGKCLCLEGYEGRACDKCHFAYYSFPNCLPCNCDIDGTVPTMCNSDGFCQCDENGQCPCKFQPCNCNPSSSHKEECDPLTGKCLCLEGYEGRACDKCHFAYYSFPNCLPCNCDIDGTVPTMCNSDGFCQCDENGQCPCKKNVIGFKCDECKAGTFSLTFNNKEGCLECFCFGRSTECEEAYMVWSQITGLNRKLVLEYGNTQLSLLYGLYVIPGHRGNIRIGVLGNIKQPLYWMLPQEYLGDKILAYNGNLQFRVTSDSNQTTDMFLQAYPLILIQGNHHLVLIHTHFLPSINGLYTIPLNEKEWQHLRNPQLPVTRATLMVTLQNLQYILIRATDSANIKEARLESLSLDVAVPVKSNLPSPYTAVGIESCKCPLEYSGSSCQNPNVGYYRKHSDNYLYSKNILDLIGWAEPCPCNNRSKICDENTGICMIYKFNRCSDGYYGNPFKKDGFCKSCNCNSYGSISQICDKITGQCHCKEGIFGRDCSICQPHHILTESKCISFENGIEAMRDIVRIKLPNIIFSALEVRDDAELIFMKLNDLWKEIKSSVNQLENFGIDKSSIDMKIDDILNFGLEVLNELNTNSFMYHREMAERELRLNYDVYLPINETYAILSWDKFSDFTYQNNVNMIKNNILYVNKTLEKAELNLKETKNSIIVTNSSFESLSTYTFDFKNYTQLLDYQYNILARLNPEYHIKWTQLLDYQYNILARLNPEYHIKYVLPCQEHALKLQNESQILVGLCNLESAKFALKASTVFKDIVEFIDQAYLTVKNASLIAKEAYSKVDPNSKYSLSKKLNDVMEENNNILNDAEFYINYINYSRIENVVKSTMIIQTAVSESIHKTKQKVNNITSKYPEIYDKIKRLESSTLLGMKNLTFQIDQSQENLEKASRKQHSSETLFKRLRYKHEEVSSKLKALKDNILLARQKASSIRISLTTDKSGICVRSFQPDIEPATTNHIRINYSIKDDVRDSLLFFLANNKTDDFMAVEMINRKIRFLWNAGGGTKVISHNLTIKTNEYLLKNEYWYKIEVIRVGNIAKLRVQPNTDGQLPDPWEVEGTSPVGYSKMDFDQSSHLYVGGLPKLYQVPRELKTQAFFGCLYGIILDGKHIPLWNFLTNLGCDGCKEGIIDQADVNAYRFEGNGYAILPQIRRYNIYTFLVTLQFKTYDEDALLFFMSDNVTGHFVSLELQEGHVVYQFDLGNTSRLVLKTQKKYNNGNWSKLTAGRDMLQGQLSVDDELQEGKLPERGPISLELSKSLLYFGGVTPGFGNNKWSRVTFQNYLGCMKDLQIDTTILNLLNYKYYGVESGCKDTDTKIVSFKGTGYIEVISHPLTEEGNFGFTFQSTQTTSLLMISTFEGFSTSMDKKMHYYAVMLLNGKLEARFNANAGEVRITSEQKFNDGIYHSLKVVKRNRKIIMIVDDKEIGNIRMPKGSKTIEAPDEGGLFFGGVPEEVFIGNRTATREPFKGVIKDAIFNDRLIQFNNPIRFKGVGIGHGRKYYSAFMGPSLPFKPSEHCAEMSSYTLEKQALQFGNKLNSYAKVFIRRTDFGKDFNVTFDFRTFYPNGLMVLLRNKRRNSYFAIILKRKYIIVDVRDKKHRKLKSQGFLSNGVWHNVTVTKINRNLTLSVDENKIFHIKVRRKLALRSPLYLGGIPTDLLFNHSMKSKGFKGCIRKFNINGRYVDPSVEESVNIGHCFSHIELGAYFGGDAYALYDNKFNLGSSLEIQLLFKTTKNNGILLSLSDNSKGSIFGIELHKGNIIASVNTVGIPLQAIKKFDNKYKMCDGEWHLIRVQFLGQEINLKIDKYDVVYSVVGNNLTPEISTAIPLFIGGLPDEEPLGILSSRDNFKGCIKNIAINHKLKDWINMHRLENVLPNSCPVF
ncbi:laminin subunit alpha-1-like [Centruroides sculpturatus]|uniref:laminin subunit alpha-1-like n=1 Tax=Centruroides sculpturatus TaxID=218467 RepID=UPI000C6D27B8|nr:laminin subunit alpha-1-like [Centruroides sculpturatus]